MASTTTTRPCRPRTAAKRGALKLVPTPSQPETSTVSAQDDPAPSQAAAPEETPAQQEAPAAGVHTLSLTEPDWQKRLHDEDYWQGRVEKAQRAIAEIAKRARTAEVGLPAARIAEIQDNAIRAFWQALAQEGRLTLAEVQARVTETMLRYYEPALQQLVHEATVRELTGDPRSVGMGGRGSALDAARGRSNPDILHANLRHVRFKQPSTDSAADEQTGDGESHG